MSRRDTFIIDAVRTPIGKFGGALAPIRTDDLAALVIRSLIDRHDFDPVEIDDIILGCANQAGEDNRNVARMALLLAGLPFSVPGETVNRLCASGMSAVINARITWAAKSSVRTEDNMPPNLPMGVRTASIIKVSFLLIVRKPLLRGAVNGSFKISHILITLIDYSYKVNSNFI